MGQDLQPLLLQAGTAPQGQTPAIEEQQHADQRQRHVQVFEQGVIGNHIASLSLSGRPLFQLWA